MVITKLGFLAPVNFVFLVMIAFFINSSIYWQYTYNWIKWKNKDLDHYIALKEHKDNNK